MRPAVLLPSEGQFRALCPPIHWPRAAWGTVRGCLLPFARRDL